MTLVISAFPGTGKSTFYNKWKNKLKISDSDSSNFSKDNFPANYIADIKKLIDENYDVVLVSSHEEVRKALKDAGIDYTFILPYWDGRPETLAYIKEIYMKRYKGRGSTPKFLEIADKLFETWLASSMNDKLQDSVFNYILLSPTAYLSEVEGHTQFREVLEKHNLVYEIDLVKPLDRLLDSYGLPVIKYECDGPLYYDGEKLNEFQINMISQDNNPRRSYEGMARVLDNEVLDGHRGKVKAIVYRPVKYIQEGEGKDMQHKYSLHMACKIEE